MSWVITGSQPFPAVIGEPFGGGYFAGYISHTADGNATHALIVAPKSTGESSSLQWKTVNTTTTNTSSVFDGAANTAAMVTAGIADHPAAEFCVGLSIGGFSDWYLPSQKEIDIAYFHLKPTTGANNASWGNNVYAIPQRNSNWTTSYPAVTYVPAFAPGGAELFSTATYFTSTEGSATGAWGINMASGSQASSFTKNVGIRVRAFRRIAL